MKEAQSQSPSRVGVSPIVLVALRMAAWLRAAQLSRSAKCDLHPFQVGIMQFPQDGGLSCVRYYLVARDDALTQFVHARMQSSGIHVGRLVCQCGSEDYWEAYEFLDGPLVILGCGCNGSSLPVYIGKPPFENGRTVEPEPNYADARAKQCRCGKEWCNRMSIGIGYPGRVPRLGTIDVERAQEVLIAAECKECGNTEVKWHLRLPAPPVISGDEPWIRSIQGLGYGSKTRWQ